MRNTGIQWCDDTVNPTSGCDGCELYQPAPPGLTQAGLKDWLAKWPCYAAQVHENRLALSLPEKYGRRFSEVRLIPGRLQNFTNAKDLTGLARPDKPWLNGLPRLVFISDMADALSAEVPFEYLLAEIIVPVIAWQKHRHIGMWLTKRPDRMLEFSKWLTAQGLAWPANLWAGTSATTQPTADERIPWLLKIPATHFVSVEPMRSRIVFRPDWLADPRECSCYEVVDGGHQMGCQLHGMTQIQRRNYMDGEWPKIDLVIFGGESGQKAHLHKLDVALVRAGRDQCQAHGTPVFIKQLGAAPFTWAKPDCVQFRPWQNMDLPPRWEYHWALNDSHGGDWSEWPEDLRVRQMPGVS